MYNCHIAIGGAEVANRGEVEIMKTTLNARRIGALLLALAMCFALFAGCRGEMVENTKFPTPPQKLAGSEALGELIDEMFEKWVTSDSLMLNYMLADPSRFGIVPPKPTYGEVTSPASIAENREETRDFSERLGEIAYGELDAEQQLIYDSIKRNLDLSKFMEGKDDYYYYTSEINPGNGLQTILPVLLAEFVFRTADDIETYLQLLEDTRRFFGDMIEVERVRSEKGFFMNDANVDTVIANCESFVENREDNPLILTFNEKIDGFEGLTAEEREQFKARNKESVLGNVLSAYDDLIAAMRELRGKGANKGGLSSLPDGEKYAEMYLKLITGSDKTPAQVDELLVEQLDSTMARMGDLVKGNIDVYQEILRRYPDLIPEESPKAYLDKLEQAMKKDFPPIKPVRYVTHEVHESLEEFLNPAFYFTPALDSFDDNVIYINKSKITGTLSLFTVLGHEGYPGHLYQTVYFLQKSPHPVRRVLEPGGYSEGWASYVEMISYSYAGLNETEAEIMRISRVYELLLTCRIDLCVNALGWDQKRLGEYLDLQEITDTEELFNQLVGDPLVFLKYGLGYLEFEALLEEARTALGGDFVLMEFHRFILDLGPAPFALIRARMHEWLASS